MATNHREPLTAERLHQWHRLLFPGPNPVNFAVCRWLDDRMGPMCVVSGGPMERTPIIHFEAPATERIEDEMDRFLEWFNQPEHEPDLRKPAIAHRWFVTIQPYDDDNGRIARNMTEPALVRCGRTPMRCYSMSGEILRQCDNCYQALMTTQSGSMDITNRMVWSLHCLTSAMDHSDRTAGAALSRTRLRVFAQSNVLNARRMKFPDRMLDGWSGNITTARYGRVTRCSRQTAIGDINQLIKLGILVGNQASARSTSYWVEASLPWDDT